MGLFDRFKKEKAGEKDTPSPPMETDTAGKLLFLRERLEGQELREAVTRRFGPEALGELNQDHPAVTSFLVRLEGVEFWCAHMALPLPPKEGDLPALLVRSSFFSQEELDRNGDGVLQYVMLEGEPGHQDALMRTEYSVRTLVSAGVPVEKLANNNADWQRGQAKMRMQQWLDQLEKPIEVIFANNDDMALGAIDALVEEGIPPEEMPFIVGVDATPPALAAMAEGSLKGTVQNDAKGQAERMLELCCKLAFGEELPPEKIADGHYVWLWYTAVTKENLTALLGELS